MAVFPIDAAVVRMAVGLMEKRDRFTADVSWYGGDPDAWLQWCAEKARTTCHGMDYWMDRARQSLLQGVRVPPSSEKHAGAGCGTVQKLGQDKCKT